MVLAVCGIEPRSKISILLGMVNQTWNLVLQIVMIIRPGNHFSPSLQILLHQCELSQLLLISFRRWMSVSCLVFKSDWTVLVRVPVPIFDHTQLTFFLLFVLPSWSLWHHFTVIELLLVFFVRFLWRLRLLIGSTSSDFQNLLLHILRQLLKLSQLVFSEQLFVLSHLSRNIPLTFRFDTRSSRGRSFWLACGVPALL